YLRSDCDRGGIHGNLSDYLGRVRDRAARGGHVRGRFAGGTGRGDRSGGAGRARSGVARVLRWGCEGARGGAARGVHRHRINDAPFADRAKILDASRAFYERGGRLVRLVFPETQAQRFGDVVVLYGRYEVVFQSGGAEHTRRGRLTEMFVRRDGKWLHPGWHLDLTAGPAPSKPGRGLRLDVVGRAPTACVPSGAGRARR